MGEETDGVIESVSKLQAKVKGLSGVDILTDTGAYKDTYTIIKEIGQVWADMNDINRAALLELLAGKNRSNAMAALLTNMEDLEGAYESAMKAQGSAEAENEKYMNSIQGKIDQFTNSLQTMWKNAISSDVVKIIIDAGTALIKFVDKLGLIPSILTAIIAIKAFKILTPTISSAATALGLLISESVKTGVGISSLAKNTKVFGDVSVESFKKVGAGIKSIGTGLKSVGKFFVANPVVAAITAVVAAAGLAFTAYKKVKQAEEEAAEAASKYAEEIRESNKSLDEYKTRVEELRKSLDSGNLSEEEAYNTRKELISIQDELISKYGKEAEGINLVTGAINGQIEAIDKLAVANAKDWLNENSKQSGWWIFKGKSPIDKAIEQVEGTQNAFIDLENFDKPFKKAYGDNYFDQYMEAYNDFQDYVTSELDGAYIAANGEIKFSNKTREEIAEAYNQMIDWLRNYAKNSENKIDFGQFIGEITASKDKLVGDKYDTYKATYDAYLENTAVESYTDVYGEILDAQAEFKKAYESGDQKAAQEAKTNLQNAIESAKKEAGNDTRMANWFDGLDDDFQVAFNDIDFDAAWETAGSDLKSSIEKALKDINLESDQEILNLGSFIGDDGKLKDGVDGFTQEQANAYNVLKSKASEYGMTIDELIAKLVKLGLVHGDSFNSATNVVKAVGKTVSSYSDSLEKFTNAQSIQNEVIYDNIKLTTEQGDALKELIGSEAEYSNAIDDTNGYIVKDTALLNKLIAKKRQEALQNVKTEKTQTRLKYHDLYKQIRKLSGANGELATKNKAEINALYAEMGAVERTIAKYSMLEQQLLGAANAYSEYDNAKTADQEKDYGSKAADMLSGVINGLQSAKLGTETFKTAVAGMIPEDVYSNLDTVEEKVAAIANYLKNSNFSKYFTLKFDDDGTLQSAEMKLDNVRAFIEDAQEEGVFTNKGDWQHFELSDDIKSLDDFCSAMKITKEMAFAMFTEIDSYDAEWLNGNFGSMLDKLDLGLEGNITMTEKRIAELDVALANGKITAEEYAAAMYGTGDAATEEQKKIGGLNGKMQKYTESAKENALAWKEASDQYEDAKKRVEGLSKQIQNADENADTSELQKQLAEAMKEMDKYGETMQEYEVSELTIKIAIEDVQKSIDEIEGKYEGIAKHVELDNKTGKYNIKSGIVWEGDTPDQTTIDNYLSLLDKKHTLEIMQGESMPTTLDIMQEMSDTLKTITDILAKHYGIDVETGEANDNISGLIEKLSQLKPKEVVVSIIGSISNNLKTWWARITGNTEFSGTVNTTSSWDGTPPKSTSNRRQNVMFDGTAHATGNWGLPQSEKDSLVGELGMETVVDPKTGRYYTVGDNGAELVDLPKNAIVFNHLQTEQLFKNGHISSRGKALAEGNAHVTIVPNYTTPTYYNGASSSNFWTDWSNAIYDASDSISDAADSVSDAADKFEEVFDWFEVLLEEIEDNISLMNAKLENTVGISAKKGIYSEILNTEQFKLQELYEGIKLYSDYANKLLAKVPDQYKEMAKNGAVAITDFLGEANQEVVDSINNYREWAKKVTDLNQQLEETKKTIADTHVEIQNMLKDEYDNRISLITSVNDRIQDTIDLLDEEGKRSSAVMYEEMIKNSTKQLSELQSKRAEMQRALDEAVSSGDVARESSQWYEMVNAINDVDGEINDCRIDLEGFQNSINQLHWDNFEKFIDAIDNVGNEISNLGDLIDEEDVVDEVGNWTDKGVTALGLYAQEMERAKYRAEQYGKEIEYLNQEYAAGKYSEDEYLEKLQELKDGQWDSIKSYESAKKSIIDLNKTRIEAVKDGIQKEIDAYSELIDKKKEELSLQKDAHDFQKQVTEKQKEIADIQKKLAVMSGDNSASAIAQKKKLQAELAAAQEELDELYYNHSVEKQQEALDKSLENYQDNKQNEMDALDESLKNEEQIIADSYATITANTESVAQTLSDIASQYGITLSDSVMQPWLDGANAIGTYQEQLDTSMSSFTQQLETLKKMYSDLQAQADSTGKSMIDAINSNKSKTESSTYTPPAPSQPSAPSTPSAPYNGATVTVKRSATHFSRDGGNGTRMQSWVPGSDFTVYQVSGSDVLIGRNGGYTGWVRLSDLEGYASGTKGVSKDQLAMLDELGDELVLHAGKNGRLEFLTKGTSVIPSDITENLMKLGSLDPRQVLDNNRPSIGAPHIVNNSMEINMQIAEVVHIDHADNSSIPDITKAVQNQIDAYMSKVNSSLRRYTR